MFFKPQGPDHATKMMFLPRPCHWGDDVSQSSKPQIMFFKAQDLVHSLTMPGRSAEMTESDFEFSGNATSLSNETTCCSNLSGLCEWIEPVGWQCVDEDDRKFAVWTEEDCQLIHPDDIRIYEKRYNDWLDSEEWAANALV